MTLAASPTDTIVRFQGVTKTYDRRHWALRDLNLDIRTGEFLTLLGPSGSGKTTALMLLAGFEEPTGGTILFRDRPLLAIPSYRRNFGVVFQSYALFPHMSVAENVGFPLRMRGLPRAECQDRTARALDMVRMSTFATRKPTQLSGGQQQRVAVARALVYGPELVLLDEPLAALDKNLREELQYEIRALHLKLGLTMVYVTHDQAEALTLSDRIAVFRDGAIEQIAGPMELYDQPANPFVAGFLGETNFLDATVEADGSLRLGDGTAVRLTKPAALLPRSAALLAIRPEKLVIDPGAGMANRLDAVTDDVIFQGNSAKVVATRPDGTRLVVRAPAELAGRLAPGTPLAIGFAADAARCYPKEG